MSGGFLAEKCNKKVPGIKLGPNALVQEGRGKSEGCWEQRGWRDGHWPCRWHGKGEEIIFIALKFILR